MHTNDEFIWAEKYRPHDIASCILPNHIKKKAEQITELEQMQNMLFYAGPGCGKTTLAKALCEQLDLDYIVINGSVEGRLIETVRSTVTQFASTLSMFGKSKMKVVIYDEFDNAGEVQMAVRGLMDEVSVGCRFIFTGNYITKIIDPIQSRTTMIDFSVPLKEKQAVMGQIFDRCCRILDNEGISYDKKVLVQFIIKTFPDFRKIINELQSYSAMGQIDAGILELSVTRYETLVTNIINKDFKGCEKWMNVNNYDGSIYSLILKELRKKIDGKKYIESVLYADDAQYRHSFAVDPDICLQAFCLNIIGVV